MARIRTIKPEFFENTALADLSPLHRLLFVGLWCQADRQGRMEDNPRRLKVKVLPYDACDVDTMLDDLAAAGFIQRYEANGVRVLWVVNFEKHQRITGKEAEKQSEFPAPTQDRKREATGKQRGNTQLPRKGREGKGSISPLPPAGEEEAIPFTEMPPGDPDENGADLEEEAPPENNAPRAGRRRAAPKPGLYLHRFEEWYAHYPRKRQREAAERAWDKLRPNDALVDLLIRCVEHQKGWTDWTKEDGAFIPYPASYLNGRQWRDAADELVEKETAPPASNPHAGQPWWDIWSATGEQPTYIGILNFCASVAPGIDPRAAGEVFKTSGFEAAVEYVIERKSAV